MTTIGETVKQRREALGMTQRELGGKVGTSKEYISQIESGKTKLPNAGLRRALADALGLRHVDLLIAAGELTADEIPAEGKPRQLFPPGDPRVRIVELLADVHPLPGEKILGAVATLLEIEADIQNQMKEESR